VSGKATPRTSEKLALSMARQTTRRPHLHSMDIGRWSGIGDTGPGIAPQDLPHIFERFYRTDKARSRQVGGTGLGLAIVRSVVDAHGGQVWVQSEVGKGATFSFALPYSENR